VYDRDRLLGSIDLAVLADDLLGPHTGSARTPTWPCPNPNHAQTGRTPPVTIFWSRAGYERWHCHGCGDGGTAIDLVMATDGCDVRTALGTLARRAGHTPDTNHPRPRFRAVRRPEPVPVRVTDPDGLTEFINECAQRLWTPEGRPVRRWLTRTRGLPADVLRHSRIGADPGGRQPRPDGMPSGGWAAVLPVHRNGEAIFAQLRALSTGRLRYLNASTRLAPNPRVAYYQPVRTRGPCVLVTEGILDALSATAAGYRSAALLGASIPDRPGVATDQITKSLLEPGGRLVLALDRDDAGQRATRRLQTLLADRTGHDVARLPMPDGAKDLNDWMRTAADWPNQLEHALRTAIDTTRARTLTR
jgi:DNA primase